MILAAGRGERMRPLTDRTPKPLLPVAGIPLIEHHIRRLAAAGLGELVINLSHLGEQVVDFCGDGGRWGVSIVYSREEEALETAGGLVQALPLLGDAPFMVVNGDIWTDYPFARLAGCTLKPGETAHLVMVDNPPQHPEGDFLVDDEGWVRRRTGGAGWTYAGIGLYTPAFLKGVSPGKLPLRPLLDAAIDAGRLGGEVYRGQWQDVGTPERLQALDEDVQRQTGNDE
jgi:MurNAc alpha-1-phosphate uridylyltransferase